MKVKFFGLFLCVIMFISGCGQIEHDPSTITIWHWMTDRHDAFVELASQYQEQTGIAVDFQLFVPSDIYSKKIVASAQAKILPDVFGVLDKKSVFGEFIKSGLIANLQENFEENKYEWQKKFFKKALALNIFEEGNVHNVEPGIYGVPLDVVTIQMVYNKTLLEKAGYKGPPTTFEGFIVYAQKLRSLGIMPFVSGWSELWLIDCFASNYAFNIMGEDKVMATYRGEVPYTDPDWIKVFEVFETLAKKDVVDQGIVIKSNKFAEQDFALGRAAFAFNGSWCVNVYHGMNPDLDYGVMRVPFWGHKHPLLVWGGAGSSFVVNEKSLNKDKAIAFLKWLTDKDQQKFLAEKTRNLPANKHALADLPEKLVDFGDGMKFSTHPSVWPVEEDVLVRDTMTKGIQSIIIGESTPKEIAQKVQKMKEIRIDRKKR